jgi:AcrR family transcriptional regulator
MNRIPRSDGEKTREQILEVASQCMAKSGYEGMTLRDCAKRAGITLSVIAHHFGDKEGLSIAVRERAERQFKEEVLSKGGQNANLNAMIDNIFSFWEEEPHRIRHYLWKYLEEPKLRSQPLHSPDDFIAKALKDAGASKRLDPSSLHVVITGACLFWVMKEHTHAARPSRQRLTQTLRFLVKSAIEDDFK